MSETRSEQRDDYHDRRLFKNGRNGVFSDLQAVKQEILGLENTRFNAVTKPVSNIPKNLRLPLLNTDSSFSAVKMSKSPSCTSIDKPQEFAGEYQIGGNGSEIYGKGAWSTVYKAILLPPSTSSTNNAIVDLPTPPSSPANKAFITSPKLLAIKAAGRRDAKPILENEARILTYLSTAADERKSSQHIINFLGYDTPNSALVLEAVPLTLSDYTATFADPTRQRTATTARSEPIIGTRQWLSFAANLIAGLKFLKDMGVVHGDIKPQNILLRESITSPSSSTSSLQQPLPNDNDENNNTITYTALFADFSSSHILNPTTPPSEIKELTALTAEYTAPELFSSLLPSNPHRCIATFSTDVFALGVSLLEIAIGESCYKGAGSETMKACMINEGNPMGFARGGMGWARCRKGGVVDRIVERAVVGKKVEERIVVEEWSRVLKEVEDEL
ncbi:MAG: hypothetical protein M1812_007214 [Candelaria pacifica]|nr:MAG: hypothetical protein M1812_007214 [Candelaria pacifica]